MGWPVVTVASGGMPVVDVTATTGRGTPVTEATNGFGRAVTKVASGGMPVAYEALVVWPPPIVAVTYVTLDPATVTAVTLSGGNLVATNTGTTSADQGARVIASSGKATGKYYIESKITTLLLGGNSSSGIGTTASTYTAMGNGGTTGVVCYWQGGNIWTLAGNTGNSLGVRSAGDVFGIAIDLDNRKIWFRVAPSGNWNGSGTADPATNIGGVTIPAGTMVPFITFGGTGGIAGSVNTMNFGASAFIGAVPSGFTSGWPDVSGGSGAAITTPGAGTQIVPASKTSLVGEAWGAGGAGAGGGSSSAPGGGGGGYSRFTMPVIAGQTIYYNVGSGGVGGAGTGGAGGNSWVNPSANTQPASNGCVGGGGPGAASLGTTAGGIGTIGTTNFSGGTGANGVSPSGGGGGGGAGSAANGGNAPVSPTHGSGGSPDGGNGSDGAATIVSLAGTAPGGGSGGSWSITSANGANGQVKLTFT